MARNLYACVITKFLHVIVESIECNNQAVAQLPQATAAHRKINLI